MTSSLSTASTNKKIFLVSIAFSCSFLYILKRYDAYDMPYDSLWLDIEHTDGKKYFTWDDTHFPEPDEMLEHIYDKGRKMVTIIDPHMKKEYAFEFKLRFIY